MVPVIRYLPRHLQQALQFLSRNVDRLPFGDLVDSTYPLDGVEQALHDSSQRRVNRAAIVFEEL